MRPGFQVRSRLIRVKYRRQIRLLFRHVSRLWSLLLELTQELPLFQEVSVESEEDLALLVQDPEEVILGLTERLEDVLVPGQGIEEEGVAVVIEADVIVAIAIVIEMIEIGVEAAIGGDEGVGVVIGAVVVVAATAVTEVIDVTGVGVAIDAIDVDGVVAEKGVMTLVIGGVVDLTLGVVRDIITQRKKVTLGVVTTMMKFKVMLGDITKKSQDTLSRLPKLEVRSGNVLETLLGARMRLLWLAVLSARLPKLFMIRLGILLVAFLSLLVRLLRLPRSPNVLLMNQGHQWRTEVGLATKTVSSKLTTRATPRPTCSSQSQSFLVVACVGVNIILAPNVCGRLQNCTAITAKSQVIWWCVALNYMVYVVNAKSEVICSPAVSPCRRIFAGSWICSTNIGWKAG